MQLSQPGKDLAEFLDEQDVTSVGVAVSGGSDSTALLCLARDWAEAAGARIVAATVDHGLRPEAAEEAEAVGRFCAGIGIEHAVLCWRGWDGAGNVQAEARRARYRLLAEWGRREGLEAVLLGHTMDDQAETTLMRLGRSAGVDGLAAMAGRFERDGQVFARPLLGQRRAALRDVLRARGVAWIDDPSNEDARFDRVRVRRALDDLAAIGVDARALTTVSANMADVRAALDWQVAQIAEGAVRIEAGDVLVDLEVFASVPFELRRRLLLEALFFVAGGDYAPRREAMGRMLGQIAEGQGGTLAGCVVTVRGKVLRVMREYAAVADEVTQSRLWDGRWQVDGPWRGDEILRALGEDGLRQVEDWRASGQPRQSLLASPSVWRADRLVAAPVARPESAWKAYLCPKRAGFPPQRAQSND